MRIYLAARYSRFPEMRIYRDDLVGRGHWVTSRWIDGSHELDNGRSIVAPDSERCRFALVDFDDVATSDCVISFTEDPNLKISSRGGRHVEFGLAVVMKKRLIVVGHRENVFHWLPGVEFCEGWTAALAALASGRLVVRSQAKPCKPEPISNHVLAYALRMLADTYTASSDSGFHLIAGPVIGDSTADAWLVVKTWLQQRRKLE